MRLRVFSDLHLETDPDWAYEPRGEDAVLCAGDMGSVGARDRVEAVIASCGVPFYYTPGNHDAWGGEVWEVLDFYSRLERRYPHFRCLVNQSADLGPFLVAGTPLWTDFSLNGAGMAGVSMLMAERHIGDFNYQTFVRARRADADGVRALSRLRPAHFLPWHRLAKRFLASCLATGRPVIALTHWCPSGSTLAERYLGCAANPYYTASCESLMGDNLVLWVHGHTHSFDDRIMAGTRVLRNPKGYRGREYTGWQPDLVIELPSA